MTSIPNDIEQGIARKLITAAIAKGYIVSIWEGGGWAIKRSRDLEAILMEMASTDEDTLVFRDGSTREIVGKMMLVYGNGEDVIADHSANDAMNELFQAATRAQS